MTKGIIFEIENGSAIVMTPDGDFKKVKLNHDHYQVGDEYVPAPKSTKYFKPNVIQGLAFALTLIFILYIPSIHYFSTVNIQGYVNIDINPSIELAYDDAFEVVRIKALNEDGKVIIDAMDNVIRKPLNQVISEVVEESYNLIGPYEPKATLVTITDLEGVMDVKEERALLSESLKMYRVMVLEGNETIYTEAKKDEISPGKLILLNQLGESEGQNVSVNELFERLEEQNQEAEKEVEDTVQPEVDEIESVEETDDSEDTQTDDSTVDDDSTEPAEAQPEAPISVDDQNDDDNDDSDDQYDDDYDDSEDQYDDDYDDSDDQYDDDYDDSDDQYDDDYDDSDDQYDDDYDDSDDQYDDDYDDLEDEYESIDIEDEIDEFLEEIDESEDELNEEIEEELKKLEEELEEEDEEDKEDEDDEEDEKDEDDEKDESESLDDD